MSEFTLIIGNKNYSSWSLRAWLALRVTEAPFTEVVIPLRRPDTRDRILAHSPAGTVPILKHGSQTIWDSLAINEYLAETFPAARLWPEEPEARARARAVSAEMHAGFAELRKSLPMDLRNRLTLPAGNAGLAADIRRIAEIWKDCRENFGSDGDFLFGRFSAADCMFAPVVSRFVTYGVDLDGAAARYRDAVRDHWAMREWIDDSLAESWTIDFDAA